MIVEPTMVPFFSSRPFALKQLDHLSKQLFLQSVPHQNIAEPSQRVAVRHLIAGVHTAELRKSAAADAEEIR